MNKSTMDNYNKVIEVLADYKKDAAASIEKKKAKLSDNESRNKKIIISIEGLQQVIDFNGTTDENLILTLSNLACDIGTFNHGNSSRMVGAINQAKSI